MKAALLFAVFACAVCSSTEGEWKVNEDQDKWYSLKISGVNAGIMHTVVETSQTGDIRTQETMRMQIDRGQDHVKLKFRTDFVESATGEAIDVGYSQQMAQNEIKMSYLFTPTGIIVTSDQAGNKKTSSNPLPVGEYLSRYASQQYFLERSKAGDSIIKYSTIKPEMGPQVVNVTSFLQGEEKMTVGGKEVDVAVWLTQVSGISLNTSETFSLEDGTLMRTLVDSQFGELEAVISTQQGAQDALDGEDRRAELVYSTYVVLKRPESKLQAWSGAKKSVMKVRSKEGALVLPSVGYQHVSDPDPNDHDEDDDDEDDDEYKVDRETKIITVDLDSPQLAYLEDLTDTAFTTGSAMIDNEDTEVRKLAASTLKNFVGQLTSMKHYLSSRVPVLDLLLSGEGGLHTISKNLPAGSDEQKKAANELLQQLETELTNIEQQYATNNDGKADEGGAVDGVVPLVARAKVYVKIMKKLIDEGWSGGAGAWLGQEMKRVRTMLKKKDVSENKKVEFAVRRQVLSVFKRLLKGRPAESRSVTEVTAHAHALRQAARMHITKSDLATGFASASEVVRSQTGDCSEYAVLLCALLRADNIPARVCSGLVYVEKHGQVEGNPTVDSPYDKKKKKKKSKKKSQIEVGADGQMAHGGVTGNFGWHMWTQAIIDGKWVDLDATLNSPYSVGHVLLGTTGLADADGHAGEMELVSLIGNLEVDVLSVV